MIVSGLLLDGIALGITFLVIIAALILIPVIQSYVLYKQAERSTA